MRAWLSCRSTCAAAPRSLRRGIVTGDGYTYRPGRVARALRCVTQTLLTTQQRQQLAVCMQRRLTKVEGLEKEQLWLRRHGSPLRVMGLPDHASLAEVRARYRHLLVETHPDTTNAVACATSIGPASATPATTMISATCSSSALSHDESQYALLRSAYAMATDTDSLWHQNGAAPSLYRELVVDGAVSGSRALRMRHCDDFGISKSGQRRRLLLRHCVEMTTLFALASYAAMVIVVTLFVVYVLPRLLEWLLEAFDSEFYAFLIAQEEQERLRREQGLPVDTDPKRLAPTVLQKLLRPGRFIHSAAT